MIPDDTDMVGRMTCISHGLNVVADSATFGPNSHVYEFTTVCANVKVGANVVIGGRCFIGRGTTIGDGTRIQDGSFIPNGSVIGRNVFIGPGVKCADDKYPVVNNADYDAQPPVICDGASVGIGSVLLPGVRIGEGARVGGGSIVTRDVPPGALVRGEPARERLVP